MSDRIDGVPTAIEGKPEDTEKDTFELWTGQSWAS